MFQIGDTVKIKRSSNSYASYTGTVTNVKDDRCEVAITRQDKRMWYNTADLEAVVGEEQVFVAGGDCPYCEGTLEKRIGTITCNSCGQTQYDFNILTFATLEVGDLFMPAALKPSEAVVFVKKPTAADGSNACREGAEHLRTKFSGESKVVLV